MFCIIKKSRVKLQYKEVRGRSLRGFDEVAFRSDISSIDLDNVFSDNDPDHVWERMYNHIHEVIDAHCPKRTLRITIGKPEYVTDPILSLMKQRDKAFKTARRLNTSESWRAARLFRARVAKELRAAKKSYIRKQLAIADI